jgi:CDGSH iron-sulfur domain-containing protein 3
VKLDTASVSGGIQRLRLFPCHLDHSGRGIRREDLDPASCKAECVHAGPAPELQHALWRSKRLLEPCPDERAQRSAKGRVAEIRVVISRQLVERLRVQGLFLIPGQGKSRAWRGRFKDEERREPPTLDGAPERAHGHARVCVPGGACRYPAGSHSIRAETLGLKFFVIPMPDPALVRQGPCTVTLKVGRTYFWCACGRSQRQPFCDGSHAGTGLTPVRFAPRDDQSALLCGCKHTGSEPFCDCTRPLSAPTA